MNEQDFFLKFSDNRLIIIIYIAHKTWVHAYNVIMKWIKKSQLI